VQKISEKDIGKGPECEKIFTTSSC